MMDTDEHALDPTAGIAVRIAGDNGDTINLYEWMTETLEHLRSIDSKLIVPLPTIAAGWAAIKQRKDTDDGLLYD